MKGQYFSFDAIIGAVIFVLAIAMLLNYWYGVRAVVQSQSRDLGAEALAMSDTLLSDGVPVTWYNDIHTAKTPGLLTAGALNKTKIMRFKDQSTASANYTRLKELFGLTGEYYVTIMPYDTSGNPDTANSYEMGNATSPAAAEVGHATRGAVFLGKVTTVDVYVWSTRLPS